MKQLLRPLWRPTLLRRVLGALVLAFGLVGVALVALNYLEFQQAMTEKPGVLTVARALVTALADVPDPKDAALILGSEAVSLNHLRKEEGSLPGSLQFQLRSSRTGVVAFSTPGIGQTALPAAPEHVAVLDVAGQPHWVSRADAGPWQLILAEPRVADSTVVAWLGRDLIGSLLIAFPLVMLPLWVAVRRGMRPLNRLADTIAQRSAQDLTPIGFTPKHEELKPLVTAFDDLLDRLRQQLQRERAFVQDAAHELRTPMAVVAAQAHVLAHAVDAAERAQAATALDQALQRAAHLSRQLLTLATLDESRPSASERLDLAPLVEQALAQVAPQALAKGLDLSLEAPPELPAQLDRTAFESILLNLMDNALRYVPAGGRIVVSLSRARRDRHAVLQVADDGPGIPPAQRGAAFERFWRGASSSEIPGTGLGLAIVRQAAARLGGQVRLTDGLEGRGVAFVAEFPV